MAHAFIHAANQHHQRCVRSQRQIAQGGKPEAERDRHAGKHTEAGDTDEEDDQVEIAERPQQRLCQPKQRDDAGDRQQRRQQDPRTAVARQPQQRECGHQADADGQRGRAPGVGNLQRGRGDEAFFVGVFVGRLNDQDQERQRRAGRDRVEIEPHRGRRAADHGGHPHVLGAPECHRGPQHRQPQEQHRGQLVRPDQRLVQHVAGDHARKQDDDLGDDQDRRRDLDQQAEQGLDPPEQGVARGPDRRFNDRLRDREFGDFDVSHGRVSPPTRYESLPTAFSSSAQASSPYLPFHSA
jgi:hypothetical protein